MNWLKLGLSVNLKKPTIAHAPDTASKVPIATPPQRTTGVIFSRQSDMTVSCVDSKIGSYVEGELRTMQKRFRNSMERCHRTLNYTNDLLFHGPLTHSVTLYVAYTAPAVDHANVLIFAAIRTKRSDVSLIAMSITVICRTTMSKVGWVSCCCFYHNM